MVESAQLSFVHVQVIAPVGRKSARGGSRRGRHELGKPAGSHRRHCVGAATRLGKNQGPEIIAGNAAVRITPGQRRVVAQQVFVAVEPCNLMPAGRQAGPWGGGDVGLSFGHNPGHRGKAPLAFDLERPAGVGEAGSPGRLGQQQAGRQQQGGRSPFGKVNHVLIKQTLCHP